MVLTNDELQVLVHQLARIATALEGLDANHKRMMNVVDRLTDLTDAIGETEDGRKFIRIRRK